MSMNLLEEAELDGKLKMKLLTPLRIKVTNLSITLGMDANILAMSLLMFLAFLIDQIQQRCCAGTGPQKNLRQ